MRFVPPPDRGDLPSLEDIQQGLKSEPRSILEPKIAAISRACVKYDEVIPSGLHELSPISIDENIKETLEHVFSRRLGPFKQLLNKLTSHLEETHNVTCPFCNFGEQWEHDHFLPKSKFPEFAIHPGNLVPICKVCNGKKLNQVSKQGRRIFLHVFSELENVFGFLVVRIIYQPNIYITYDVIQSDSISREEFLVLQEHFKALDLRRRYARQASALLARLIRRFRSSENIDLGRDTLNQRLLQMARDKADQCPSNHWEVVLLEHLTLSDDFVEYIFSE